MSNLITTMALDCTPRGEARLAHVGPVRAGIRTGPDSPARLAGPTGRAPANPRAWPPQHTKSKRPKQLDGGRLESRRRYRPRAKCRIAHIRYRRYSVGKRVWRSWELGTTVSHLRVLFWVFSLGGERPQSPSLRMASPKGFLRTYQVFVLEPINVLSTLQCFSYWR